MAYKNKEQLKARESEIQATIMRPSEVALHFGISVSTVWRWVQTGVLPAPSRIGCRFTYWERSLIETALQRMD